MVRASMWLGLAAAGMLCAANAAEVANTEDTPDERAQQLCSENVPCSDGYYCTLLGHCAPKFLSNAACAYDEQCAGGHCRDLGIYQYCACFSHDQCNNDMPGRKKYVCTPQNYCSPCKKKGCYPEFRFELGESCSEHNDCQSGNCDANEDGVDVCSCSPVQPCEGGAKCVNDLDCESTTCGDDGRCMCFNHKKKKVRVGCTDEQLCTKSNTCEALKLGGESCGNSKECVGKCKKGVCQCSGKVPCQDYFYCEGKECVQQLDAEETCYYDIECKSGNCENYKCGCVAGEVTCPSGQYCLENGSEEVAGQGMCSEKKDWWQLCDVNKECNSRSCEAVGNKKRCKCQVDDDCPNTNRFTCDATEGTCLVKDDKTCVVNDDPAKNLLSNGVNVRCSSGACVDGVCGLLPGGAVCVDENGNDDNTVCASSVCSSGVCECDPSAPGATCEETEFCSTTTSACTPLLLGGESCTVDDECKSGDCDSSSNECTCSGPGYCAEGQYCSSSGGNCNPAEPYGTPGCTAVGPGYCASGVCAADDTCGCVADDVCSAGEFCSMEDNTCQATRVGGEECSEDNQCQAGKCTDDKCECVSNSVYCKAGTYCSNNVCEDDKFGGESCDWNGQCLSGDCTGNMCMCTESSQCEGEDKICSVIGECVDRLVYEEPCLENNDCISGLCNGGICNCVSDDDCAGTAFPLCDSRVVGGETVQGTCVSVVG